MGFGVRWDTVFSEWVSLEAAMAYVKLLKLRLVKAYEKKLHMLTS